MPAHRLTQAILARGARRTHRREDAAAGRVQLLVARPAGAQRELLDAVAAETRVGVTIHEPRNRAEPAPVELVDLADEPREVAHPPNRLDRRAVAQDIGVFEHVHLAEGAAS